MFSEFPFPNLRLREYVRESDRAKFTPREFM